MKTNSKRYSLGLVSSLLLAIGLARAADRTDPLNVTQSIGASKSLPEAVACSGDTDLACWMIDNGS